VRGVFDQYSTQENQLTHALLSMLACDKPLAFDFLRLVGSPARPKRPQIIQQSLPGEIALLTEGEAERRGLPDGVIHEPDRYTILIEAKVAASPSLGQLKAHLETARRKGYANPVVVLITIKPLAPAYAAPWLRVVTWSQIYAWLRVRPRQFWSDQMLGFMEAKEARWSAENYLVEGTLTTFSGIPFNDEDEPYDYFQAKRIIKLMRRELLAHPALESLSADIESKGRAAITGRNSDLVWDMIPIKSDSAGNSFTQNIHLTFALLRDRLQAYVTIPNNIRARRRTMLLGGSLEEFGQVIAKASRGFDRILHREPNARPSLIVLQRRYASQRSVPEKHAELRFDPRTFFPSKSSRVKHQPQWFIAAYEAMKHRRSNLQLQIGMDFPYASCPRVRSAEAVELVAAAWGACRPILEAIED
jgi:hypothetical protein